MAFDHDEYGGNDESWLSPEDAVEYVADRCLDEIVPFVNLKKSRDWVHENRAWLDILSTISSYDRDQLRQSIRPTENAEPYGLFQEMTEAYLFEVGTRISKCLESLSTANPDAGSIIVNNEFYGSQGPTCIDALLVCLPCCVVEDDLGWVRDAVLVTRAFRDVLFVLSERREAFLQSDEFRAAISQINTTLVQEPSRLLFFWSVQGEGYQFGKRPPSSQCSLAVSLANWMCEYFVEYSASLSLGVCIECGKFFERFRRDNIYCSKTCQNRVAYKRRKIFDSGALRPVDVAPDQVWRVQAGLWVNHTRLGLGRVEGVDYPGKSRDKASESDATETVRVPELLLRSNRVQMRVRFLHGIRMLGFSDLFQSDDKSIFYSVTAPGVLADLL